MNDIKKVIRSPYFIGVLVLLVLLSGVFNGLLSYKASGFKATIDILTESNRTLQANNQRLTDLNEDNITTVRNLNESLTRVRVEADRGEQLISDLTASIGSAGDTVEGIIRLVQELIDQIQSYSNSSSSVGIRPSVELD